MRALVIAKAKAIITSMRTTGIGQHRPIQVVTGVQDHIAQRQCAARSERKTIEHQRRIGAVKRCAERHRQNADQRCRQAHRQSPRHSQHLRDTQQQARIARLAGHATRLANRRRSPAPSHSVSLALGRFGGTHERRRSPFRAAPRRLGSGTARLLLVSGVTVFALLQLAVSRRRPCAAAPRLRYREGRPPSSSSCWPPSRHRCRWRRSGSA